jgi:hypothetical protein
MKVSGFTFIRNAIKYDFPIVESIRSILPVCDDCYVAVGNSDDGTLELVQSIDPKIRIIETVWDENLIKGGIVLARETDKALKMVPEDSDWCFYIQADEAVHEEYLKTISEAMHRWKDNPEVDGLLCNYLHFFGSYDYISPSPNWYRREIRIIKNDPSIYSYRDAQGFRKDNNKKLRVKLLDAWIYHYGMVRHPKIQYEKRTNSINHFYKNISSDQYHYQEDEFDYGSIDILERYEGTHPEVMKERIAKVNWQFNPDLSINRMSIKNRFRKWMQKHFGYIPWEYRNYKII